MIERLTGALVQAGLSPEPGELADVLWLAAQLADTYVSANHADATPLGARAEADVHALRLPPVDLAPPIETELSSSPAEGMLKPLLPAAPQFVSGSFADGVLRVRGVAATNLPDRLTRPLQAFSKRQPSQTDTVLDEEATAEYALETGVWVPVLNPSREYAFDLLLVVEDSDTSSLWTDAIAEFAQMLLTQTAFQRVHELRLLSTDTAELMDKHGRIGYLSDWRSKRTVQVVLVSDTLSRLWQGGLINRLVRKWRNIGPLTLLQPMPRGAWRHLPMGEPSLNLSSHAVVQDNGELSVTDEESLSEFPPGTFVLPVIGFDEESLGSWAAVMTGRADVSVPGIGLVPYCLKRIGVEKRGTVQNLSGPERVVMFRQMASQAAYELAVSLSVMEELTIPLMRLIQRFTHPNSSAEEMAQVFLGGLLEPIVRQRMPEDRHDRLYRFIPGVREVLVTSRRRSDEIRVDFQLTSIDEAMPREQQTLPVMSGNFRQPEAGQRLTDWVLPFRPVSREILHRHMRRRLSEVSVERRDEFNLDREIILQRSVMKRIALGSNYALLDDNVLDDFPLVVSAEESIWIVGLVRYVLIIVRTGIEKAMVATAIPVDQIALVEAKADSVGRGQLHFHQLNHIWDFDTQIWRKPFELQMSVNNLGLLGKKARTDRMLNMLQERRLLSENCPPNEIFWKLEIETSRGKADLLPEHWSAPSLHNDLPGWLSNMQPDMIHTFRAPRANTILQVASLHLQGDDTDVFAIPLHVPRPLSFVHFEMSDVETVMGIAKYLYLDREKVLQAVQQGVRALWKGANGISWSNPLMEDQITYSFFIETIESGDLEYNNLVSLSDLGIGAAYLADKSNQEDVDLQAMANAVTEAVDADRVRGLSDALETEIREAVERADWDVDASTSFYYEIDDTYGILKEWQFGGLDDTEFEPIGFDDGILTVKRHIVATVEVSCSFGFSVKDGVDKDMVYIGSTEVTREHNVDIVAEFGFSNVTLGEPALEWVEVERISEQVDFGHVEPDYGDDEFDHNDPERN